jgi:hypothetical protein
MAWIKYSETQIKDLIWNKYVKKISEKYITFSLECKTEFLRLSNKWLFYREIFRKLWFPEYIVSSNVPQKAYDRRKTNMNKWKIEDKKWRPKKEEIDFNNMTLEQENEYLRAKLALYEEFADYMKSWLP